MTFEEFKMVWDYMDSNCIAERKDYLGHEQLEVFKELHEELIKSKEPLKVGDWVEYQGKEYQVEIVNEDSTVRLATDDTTERYYYNGTIGCFGQGMLTKIEKK